MARKRRTSSTQDQATPDVSNVIPPRDGPAYQGENALTEEQAIDQLLSSLPSEDVEDTGEASDDHAEAETLESDAHQDNQGTEATVSEEDELIIDEADEESTEAEGPAVYEVPWDDGTVRQLTAEEIRAGTLMRSDYDRKQAERAKAEEAAVQAKQAYEARSTALDGVLADLSRVQETGLPSPPDPALARDDPAEYIARKADYDAKMLVVEKATKEAEEARAEQLRQLREQNAQALFQAMPAWQDPTRQQTELAEIRQYGSSNGWFTAEQFDQGVTNTPHWILQVLHKARLYDRAVARRNGKGNGAAPVQKRVVKRSPTVRSQASQPQSSKTRVTEQAAWKRFLDQPSGAGAENRAVDALMATVERKGARHRRA